MPDAASKRNEKTDKYRYELPFFVKRPEDTFIVSLTTGLITVRITGAPKLEVTWLKNWQPIKDNSRFKTRHYEPDIYVLEIQDALTTDMGIYTCCARNDNGTTRASAKVHIVYMKNEEYPHFLKHLENTNVLAGQKCQLLVTVFGSPTPEVKWFKNWTPIMNQKNIESRHYHYNPNICILNIYNAQAEDSGLYICKARNDAGTVYTSAVVKVDDGKRIYAQPFNIPRSNDYLYDTDWLEDVSYIRRHLQRMDIEMEVEANKKDLMEKKTAFNYGRRRHNYDLF